MNIKQNWIRGEFQDTPLTPNHDRGVFCVDVSNNYICTGSADHGLRVYDLKTGKYCRELFNKRYGHKEWVTTCSYLPCGRLISGGMDGLLCYWEKSVVKCDTLQGHETSISKVMTDEHYICISASYDCTLNLWNLQGGQQGSSMYGPHKNAILDFDWRNSLLVSGDKNGCVAFWDLHYRSEGRYAGLSRYEDQPAGLC